MDPYIEAQLRLDRGESVCTIDTSLDPSFRRAFKSGMSTDTHLLKTQSDQLKQLAKIMARVEAMEEQKARIQALLLGEEA